MEHEVLTTARLRLGGVEFECWDAESFGHTLRVAWNETLRRTVNRRPAHETTATPLHIYDAVMAQWWAVADNRGVQIGIVSAEVDAGGLWELVERTLTGMEKLHIFSRQIEGTIPNET